MSIRPRSVACASTAVFSALLTLTGCSEGDDASAQRRAAEIRTATCQELEDDVRRLTVSRAEALIWDNKLYKTDIPVPKVLLDDNGEPVPFDDMTDQQRSTYIDWKNGSSSQHNLAWAKSARDKLDEIDEQFDGLDVLDRCMGRGAE